MIDTHGDSIQGLRVRSRSAVSVFRREACPGQRQLAGEVAAARPHLARARGEAARFGSVLTLALLLGSSLRAEAPGDRNEREIRFWGAPPLSGGHRAVVTVGESSITHIVSEGELIPGTRYRLGRIGGNGEGISLADPESGSGSRRYVAKSSHRPRARTDPPITASSAVTPRRSGTPASLTWWEDTPRPTYIRQRIIEAPLIRSYDYPGEAQRVADRALQQMQMQHRFAEIERWQRAQETERMWRRQAEARQLIMFEHDRIRRRALHARVHPLRERNLLLAPRDGAS